MTAPIAQTPVTILDVYTKQIELAGEVKLIHEQLKPIQDHERRIRGLEMAKAKIVGGSVVVGTVFGGLSGWVAVLLTRR